MHLSSLKVHHFRNLSYIDWQPSPAFNFVVGENGSGKSSLLEAIYLLSTARSFRSKQARSVIQYGESALTVYGEITVADHQVFSLGVQKENVTTKISISGESAKTPGDLAALFPVLLINNDCYRLLVDGPKYRRQFIDWGLFYFNPHFFSHWQQWRKILEQRNASLRNHCSREELSVWNSVYIHHSEQIETFRQEYLDELLNAVTRLLDYFPSLPPVQIVYKQGWPVGVSLEEQLANSFYRDQKLGFTQYGPHRSDLSILVHEHPAHLVLSRGQQKALSVLLRLAQALFFKERSQQNCVLLIDDLPAELDTMYCEQAFNILALLNYQCFLTSVEAPASNVIKPKLFHVEHGCLRNI